MLSFQFTHQSIPQCTINRWRFDLLFNICTNLGNTRVVRLAVYDPPYYFDATSAIGNPGHGTMPNLCLEDSIIICRRLLNYWRSSMVDPEKKLTLCSLLFIHGRQWYSMAGAAPRSESAAVGSQLEWKTINVRKTLENKMTVSVFKNRWQILGIAMPTSMSRVNVLKPTFYVCGMRIHEGLISGAYKMCNAKVCIWQEVPPKQKV